MDIQKSIYDLRKFAVNDTKIFDRILDIMENLNARVLNHGEVLKDIKDTHRDTHHNINTSFHECEARITSNDVKIAKIEKTMPSNVMPEQPQEELKPCLVCNSIYIDYSESKDFDFPGQDSRSIKCKSCGLLLEVPKRSISREQLILRWNRQPNA